MGVKSRIGEKREDMPWVETEFDEEFKRWIIDFPKAQLPYVYELLEKYREEKTIVAFKSRKESEAYLSKLRHKQFINQESEKSL